MKTKKAKSIISFFIVFVVINIFAGEGVVTSRALNSRNTRRSLDMLVHNAAVKFEEIKQKLLDKDIDGFIFNLADNGEPVFSAEQMLDPNIKETGQYKRYSSDSFKQDIDQTIKVIKTVYSTKPTMGDARIIKRETEVVKESDGAVATTEHVDRTIVYIPLLGSSEGTKESKVVNAPGVPPSIGKGGDVQIIMIFEGGRWYWNPFGW